MQRDGESWNTYNYGDSKYWDARYLDDGSGAAFDWYQRYPALRPFLRKFIPTSSRILMLGCGNALISEDMVRDGYEEIVNVDISSVAIDMMRTKYAHVSQLKYLEMDVRDMSFFPDEYFDSIIDKGTLDSLMEYALTKCRILKTGGIYMLITYGDPSARVPHIKQPGCNWKILLHVLPRPGFHDNDTGSSRKSNLEPVPLTEKGLLAPHFVLEDPDCHFIYICKKMEELADITTPRDL